MLETEGRRRHGGSKTEYRLWVHASGVFALVLAAALLLTAYMEYGAIQQDRDRMSHIAQSIGSETYETLLSEMGKTRVLGGLSDPDRRLLPGL